MRGGIDPGDLPLRSRYGRISDPGMGTYPPLVRRDLGIGPRGNSSNELAPCHMSPSQSAITQWGWGFHTLRGGIDPDDLCFRPRNVGVVEIWKVF